MIPAIGTHQIDHGKALFMYVNMHVLLLPVARRFYNSLEQHQKATCER